MFFFVRSVALLTSPLFPYTTLFRSVNSLIARKAGLMDDWRPDEVALAVKETLALSREKIEDRFCLEPGEDRKSTRLNSSHVEISYAVFCLKKKRIVGDATKTRRRQI